MSDRQGGCSPSYLGAEAGGRLVCSLGPTCNGKGVLEQASGNVSLSRSFSRCLPQGYDGYVWEGRGTAWSGEGSLEVTLLN